MKQTHGSCLKQCLIDCHTTGTHLGYISQAVTGRDNQLPSRGVETEEMGEADVTTSTEGHAININTTWVDKVKQMGFKGVPLTLVSSADEQ